MRELGRGREVEREMGVPLVCWTFSEVEAAGS